MHTGLAGLARSCAIEVERYIEAEKLATQEYSVGKVRLHLRQHLLRPQLTAIDALLRQVLAL